MTSPAARRANNPLNNKWFYSFQTTVKWALTFLSFMLRASLKYSNIECSEGPTQDWQHPTKPINIGITFCEEDEAVKTNRWKTAGRVGPSSRLSWWWAGDTICTAATVFLSDWRTVRWRKPTFLLKHTLRAGTMWCYCWQTQTQFGSRFGEKSDEKQCVDGFERW